ncbi:putative FluG domain-containing protein [Seiridium cardinale]|uniref:FluG domain-containing protein n=1 Tax=Seiridium cardinale TaxID=138064 RepID=A0ABR2X9F1_9PEZI
MVMDFLDHICEHEKILSEGTSWEYWRQYKQLYASVTGRYMDRNDSREVLKWHNTYLVPRHDLRTPKIDGKPVLRPNDLLALLTFNIAYDTGIFPTERHRVNLTEIYLFLSYTGARLAEIVDDEKQRPKDGSCEDLWDRRTQVREGKYSGETGAALDKGSQVLEGILTQPTKSRGPPKALCYEAVTLTVIRHPETGEDVLAMTIKLIHHKGADNNPHPTIFFFAATRRLIFCPILVIISLALADVAFAARGLTSASQILQIKNEGPTACTRLRWKQEWPR